VCLTPIWVLPDYFAMLELSGAKRVVALSSTSVFTKESSGDPAERGLARSLAEGESRLAEWGRTSGIEVTILRSTLIYGLGRDKNISAIAGFIRRFGFFPLFSAAQGLRQPVHAADVAAACLAALQRSQTGQGAYNLSGGETLTYRDMVARVFAALHKPVRFVRVPAWVFRLSVAALRNLPHFAHWSPEMVGRMNIDLVFSHSEAARDLSFAPRGFALAPEDLPAR
jgi:nucleoside-diphosphate-sugar epimerase